MSEIQYCIKDWADNDCFNNKKFNSFDDAEEFLNKWFDDNGLNYEENRGEYFIEVR